MHSIPLQASVGKNLTPKLAIKTQGKASQSCQEKDLHCVKGVCIQSFSGPHFPAIGLNTGSKSPYSVRMQENPDQKNSEYSHFSRSTFFTIVFVVDFEHYRIYWVIVLSDGKVISTKFIFRYFSAALS